MYNTYMLKNKFISFMLFAIATYSASFIGGISTINSKEPWYSSLNKSFLTPPDWIFAPVWTTLYLFMTIAIWLAWQKNFKNLNFSLALANLIVLILFIVILTVKFNQISIISYYLMIPYLLWSCYALILNATLLYLN